MAKVSVLMPLYNSSRYLDASIRSILNQTESDFELIIIDDGSTDGCCKIVESFQDHRIRFYKNPRNLGVAATLNRGIELSKSDYIARMDADDVSLPYRLRQQLDFMQLHPRLDICGSWVRMEDAGGKGHVIRYPLDHETIRAFMLFNNPIAHPSVMLRKRSLLRHNLQYDESLGAGQDYEFWHRCSEKCTLSNIGKPLLIWRQHEESVTSKDCDNPNSTALLVQENLLDNLGLASDKQMVLFNKKIGTGQALQNTNELNTALSWLELIITNNHSNNCFDDEGLAKACAIVWFRLHMNSAALGINVLDSYFRPEWRHRYKPYFWELGVTLFYLLKSKLTRNLNN